MFIKNCLIYYLYTLSTNTLAYICIVYTVYGL